MDKLAVIAASSLHSSGSLADLGMGDLAVTVTPLGGYGAGDTRVSAEPFGGLTAKPIIPIAGGKIVAQIPAWAIPAQFDPGQAIKRPLGFAVPLQVADLRADMARFIRVLFTPQGIFMFALAVVGLIVFIVLVRKLGRQ